MPLLNGRRVEEFADLFKTALEDIYGLLLPSTIHWRLFLMAILKKKFKSF